MKPEYKLAPSILAADFAKLADELARLKGANADYVHIDVMDGMFVPNISVGIPVVRSIRQYSDMFFDVHLMIEEPIRYIKRFAEAGADGITVHIEACSDMPKTLDAIENAGVKAAICLSPDTPYEDILPYLDRVYMVLVMSVYPGYGGQELIESTLVKAKAIRKYIIDNNLNVDIEMDGGIKLSNLEHVLDSGVNVIVAGTGVFKGNLNENVKNFYSAFKEYADRNC